MGFDPALVAFLQVVLIDLTLAGDNAVVIGLVAASAPPHARRRIIFWGLAAAVVLRIGLAVVAVELLTIVGLALAGGLLLLWVAWRLYRDLTTKKEKAAIAALGAEASADPHNGWRSPAFRRAIGRVVLADLSLSLDNVLGVAGAARDHLPVLVFGLILSIALTGLAASILARLLNRYAWIAYIGLAIIVYVALSMILEGSAALGGVFAII